MWVTHSCLFEIPWAPRSMGILQVGRLEWESVPFSRGSSQLRDGTGVSCIAGGSLPSEPHVRSIRCYMFTHVARMYHTWLARLFQKTLPQDGIQGLICNLKGREWSFLILWTFLLYHPFFVWLTHYPLSGASLVAHMVKKLPAMQDTWVRSLCW